MARVLDSGIRTVSTPDEGQLVLQEYLKIKRDIDGLEKRRKELYPSVMDYLDNEGFEDNSGNRVLDVDPKITGFSRVEKVLRTSRPLDQEVAIELIESKGLHAEAYEMVEVLNEQKIMELMQDGRLTADEVDSMYPVKVTYALTPKK